MALLFALAGFSVGCAIANRDNPFTCGLLLASAGFNIGLALS